MRDESATPHQPPGGRGSSGRAAHDVALVLCDGFTAFELGVVCEIFGEDRWVRPGDPWYRLSICGDSSGPVQSDSGFTIDVPQGLDVLSRVDTVIVAPTYRPAEISGRLFDELRKAHAGGSRIISLCSGVFVLAEAGLLTGRRVAAHWTDCDELARRYPELSVDSGVLFVDDGDVLTGAGSAAGIDLCLHVVRQDFGSDVATMLARQLVVPPQRDGGQAQYVDQPLPDLDDADLLADTLVWMQAHLDESQSVERLAERAAMSTRTFARRFRSATGTTPHRWLQSQRIRHAQRLLETTDLPIEVVAWRSGLSSAGNLRRHFGRIVHTTPQAYRRAFRPQVASEPDALTG